VRSLLTLHVPDAEPTGDPLADALAKASGGKYLHRTSQGDRLLSVKFIEPLTPSEQDAVRAALVDLGAVPASTLGRWSTAKDAADEPVR